MLYAALPIVSILLSSFLPPPLHLLRKAYKTEKSQHKIKKQHKTVLPRIPQNRAVFSLSMLARILLITKNIKYY